MKPLTPKQRNFAEIYIETGNASEAYRQAYNVKPTTNINVITTKASILLKKDNIAVTISKLRETEARKFEIKREDVLKGYLEIIDAWRKLMQLSMKDHLTKDEKQKFYLLKDMVKGSDYRGAYDSIAKMLGLNEPEKQQIDQTIKEIQVIIHRGRNRDI